MVKIWWGTLKDILTRLKRNSKYNHTNRYGCNWFYVKRRKNVSYENGKNEFKRKRKRKNWIVKNKNIKKYRTGRRKESLKRTYVNWWKIICRLLKEKIKE